MDVRRQPINEFSQTKATVGYDAGLRAYMIQVYNYMTMALAMTGLIAFGVAQSPQAMAAIYNTPLQWVVMFAPLGIVFYLSARMFSMNPKTALIWFMVYSAAMGLSLAFIFNIYTGASIARAFFITASVFGAMSLYGYTTKKDLTGIGSFLFMGLIGIVIASLVNLFLQSSGLQFAISIISVLVFVGLTAYDTQKIKETYYYMGGNTASLSNAAMMGALKLYLDFINLFITILRFVGDRR